MTRAGWGLPLPAIPQAWYFVCGARELAAGSPRPFGFSIGDRDFVAFRAKSGRVVVMSGRCSHFGSRLAAGRVVDDCIECPLHGWQYSANGECSLIPADDPIPDFAFQQSYPTTERFGQVYFYFGKEPRFDLPRFEDVDESELMWEGLNVFDLNCPWYLICANGFDGQHFNVSHDRAPVRPPTLGYKGNYGLQIDLVLRNTGTNVGDRMLARLAGSTIDFSVLNVGGNTMAVTSRLKRSTTFGYVNVIPLSEKRCRVVNLVMIRRSRAPLARLLVDGINVRVRRRLIKRFLSAEIPQLEGCDVVVEHFRPADETLKKFVEWLCSIHGAAAVEAAPDLKIA